MNKKAQANLLSNPKTITFILGGAIIGNFMFNSVESTIIGGVIGLLASLIR